MNKKRFVLSVMVLMVLGAVVSYSAGQVVVPPAKNPALSKLRYNQVVANLDVGGDLLVVANMDGCVQNIVTELTQFLNLMPDGGEQAAFKATLNKLPGFLQKNGFYALQGAGFSVVPRTDGLNTVKAFVAVDPAAMELPLWRGLVGGVPQKFAGLSYLPSDTVLARAGNGEIKQLWKLFKSGVQEMADQKGRSGFDAWLSNCATNMGVDIDKLMASLSGEGFFSIQLSETATIDIPGAPGTQPIKIPQPTLLIGIAVSDDTLVKVLEQTLTKRKMPVTRTPEESVVVNSLNLPLPLPIPVQPSYAVHSNFFLLGSTPAVVVAAIKASKEKTGLVSTAAYRKCFAELPAANNGMMYMNPRLMKTIFDVQTMGLVQAGKTNQAAAVALRDMLSKRMPMESSYVIVNTKTGINLNGVSSSSGTELAGAVLVAPVGLLAGIAIPSFVKARSTAQHNSCINNLRMIDSAKEQWALAEKKADGDVVDIAGVCKYIKGVKLPVCPQGGIYDVGVIGKNPKCSIPSHRMPGD